MNRSFRSLTALIALAVSLLTVAVVSAQTQPPPPPSNPGSTPSIALDVGYPFSFRFAPRVFGYGFKPGERVTISLRGISASPATAVADDRGSFEADITFHWAFCGPNAAQSTAPTVVAAGNQGSTARFSLYLVACPTLVADERIGKTPPVASGSGTGVSNPVIVVGTAQPSSSATGSSNSAPTPVTTFPSRLATFDVNGFGFAPDEHVTVREIFGTLATPPAVQTEADAQGRLSFTAKAYVPGHCSYQPHPELVASGDAGTALRVPLNWQDPLMTPCPMSPGGPTPSDQPPAPVPAGTPGPLTSISGSLSLSLHPSVARRGAMERAVIRGIGLGTVKLTVQYADHRSVQRTATAGSSGRVTLRWRVPTSVRPGKARGTLIANPGNLSLKLTFKVR